MILLLLVAIVLLGFSAVLVLRALLAGRMRNRELMTQIAAYGFAGGASPTVHQPRINAAGIATKLGTMFEGRMDVAKQRDLRLMLNAGGYYLTSVTRYIGYRVLASVVFPGLLLLLMLPGGLTFVKVMLVASAAALGYLLPSTLLRRRIRLRTERIDYEIPELVDLLVTTIEAGVGFGSALQLSARRVREPLGQELRLTLREQQMGLTLQDALQNMLARCNRSQSMRAFVQAIVQGETLGVSIGKILRDLALDMRKRRRQRAEERAQKAPIKLLFPLTFLILPAMLIVVLGPAVYALARGLSNGFGFGG